MRATPATPESPEPGLEPGRNSRRVLSGGRLATALRRQLDTFRKTGGGQTASCFGGAGQPGALRHLAGSRRTLRMFIRGTHLFPLRRSLPETLTVCLPVARVTRPGLLGRKSSQPPVAGTFSDSV